MSKTLDERENDLWYTYGHLEFDEWPEEARAEAEEIHQAQEDAFEKRLARMKKRKAKRLAAGCQWVEKG